MMLQWAKGLIGREQTLKRFAVGGGASLFAVRVAIMVVAVADVLNVLLHLFLDSVDLLPYPVFPAALVGVVITTVLAGFITFSIVYVIGLAIRDLSISRDAFERLSRTDMLSGLLNRRAFVEAVASRGRDASLILFDIDRFKAVNDTHGHHAGDRVIAAIASALSNEFSQGSVVARIGGEEFAVLIEDGSAERALARAASVARRIAAETIVVESTALYVTVSAGLAESGDLADFNALFSAADKALYFAKVSGRNRCVHSCDLAPLTGSKAVGDAPVPPLAASRAV